MTADWRVYERRMSDMLTLSSVSQLLAGVSILLHIITGVHASLWGLPVWTALSVASVAWAGVQAHFGRLAFNRQNRSHR